MENKVTEVKKTVQKRMEPELKLINMDKVEVEQIEWLFYPFIPYGKVTIQSKEIRENEKLQGYFRSCKTDQRRAILPDSFITG